MLCDGAGIWRGLIYDYLPSLWPQAQETWEIGSGEGNSCATNLGVGLHLWAKQDRVRRSHAVEGPYDLLAWLLTQWSHPFPYRRTLAGQVERRG
jgi:hypothetical protein